MNPEPKAPPGVNANTEFSGRVIEIDYERSMLVIRFEGAPPDIGATVTCGVSVAAPEVMMNGLTEAETDATASVAGIAQPPAEVPWSECCARCLRDGWIERESECTKHSAGVSVAAQAQPVLPQIAEQLTRMIASSTEHSDGLGNVAGYTIKTGALHRILGLMAGAGCTVVIPAPAQKSQDAIRTDAYPAAFTPPAAPQEPSDAQDAKRYRWLRARDVTIEGVGFVSYIPELGHDGTKLDQSIDAAMKAQPEGGE